MASGHDYEFRNFHAVEVLMWHCIEYLKSRGVVMVDFQGLPRDGSPRAKGIRNYKFEWTGNNGRRYTSFRLRRGNFGINPKLFLKTLLFFQKAVNKIVKSVKG